MQKQLVRKTPVAQTLVPKPYQVCDDIVALFLQPNQDTGCVQSSAVGQNHCTFRHDEGCSVQQLPDCQSGSREEIREDIVLITSQTRQATSIYNLRVQVVVKHPRGWSLICVHGLKITDYIQVIYHRNISYIIAS